MTATAARWSYTAARMPSVSSRAPKPSDTLFTSRWWRTAGDTVLGGTSGTGNVVIPRGTLAEAQAWGADWCLWVYPRRSSDADSVIDLTPVAALQAAGIRVGLAINTSKPQAGTVNGIVFADGEQLLDLAGDPYNSTSFLRPPPNDTGPPAPDGRINTNRSSVSINVGNMLDATNTRDRKLAEAAVYSAAGVDCLQLDDPRNLMNEPMLTGSLYSTTIRQGFRDWLNANTTSAQRTVVGLPSSLASDWDFREWLLTSYAAVFTGPSGTPPTTSTPDLMDLRVGNDILWRWATTAPAVVFRTVFQNWFYRYARAEFYSFYSLLRTAAGSVALSNNFYLASPDQVLNWFAIDDAWDFSLAEASLPTWGGSYSITDRAADLARRTMIAATNDAFGKRACFVIGPAPPLTVDADLVTTMLRQDLAMSWALGANPVAPWDVYMQDDQGVAVTGYRFMADPDDFSDLYGWVKANTAWFDGASAAPQIGVAYSADSYPVEYGSAADVAAFARLLAVVQAASDRNIPLCLLISGADWLDKQPSDDLTAALPAVVQASGGAAYKVLPRYLRAPNVAPSGGVDWDALQALYCPLLIGGAGASNCRAITRYNAARSSLLVHVLNFAVSGNATDPQTVTLTVPAWVGHRSITMHAPTGSTAITSGDSVSIGLWTIVEIGVAS